ncbi:MULTISPECIES: type III-B CRISPR module RAMP protein Cmr1 [Marinomonas]|uniref:Type III-B CRISPR module RAMP protein Cmr1 n=1 Tax=Marinomonas arctica TaxID=383750 RepID=A0A7H1J9Z5_9GAMM|nr:MULTISPECIES: type III-B CRISPR module RAMP protein Cmr1 [Marinomonas]MCS7488549.1 CRISPR-associated protein Cmr1 [Marinomonas sp. BSi20414]QNT07311.1 type III-B CRISPR module RAMP protein Cmr1 [Marinomonas arctica]GGN27625.1 type III-B CRISPR module RAMP protein Cmr1 [Marinomonas arctica]
MRRQIDGELLKGLSNELNKETEKQWQTYKCTLVTPMYGGGVEAGKVDTAMPIRASSIRGQLRFWWRIACGPKDPKELFKRETAIWGGIGDEGAKASKVQIRVKCKKINSNHLERSKSIKGFGVKYILGAADEVSCLLSGYEFVLEVHYKDQVLDEEKAQVEETLRWWASFGGIGGRTRRGFGAIKIEGLKPVYETEMKGLMKLEFISDSNGKKSFNSAEDAWKKATELFYQFRQGKGIGRNEGQGSRPGRSRWPEPDQLRRMTKKHKTDHDPVHPAGNVFPRAAFGLPIIFDFNDRTNKEPNTMTLLPKGEQRMASPLIICPYKDGEKWRAAALLLPNWQVTLVEELELSPSPSHIQPKSWPSADQVSERNRLANTIEPMKQSNGEVRPNDPLSAFLDYFKQGQ